MAPWAFLSLIVCERHQPHSGRHCSGYKFGGVHPCWRWRLRCGGQQSWIGRQGQLRLHGRWRHARRVGRKNLAGHCRRFGGLRSPMTKLMGVFDQSLARRQRAGEITLTQTKCALPLRFSLCSCGSCHWRAQSQAHAPRGRPRFLTDSAFVLTTQSHGLESPTGLWADDDVHAFAHQCLVAEPRTWWEVAPTRSTPCLTLIQAHGDCSALRFGFAANKVVAAELHLHLICTDEPQFRGAGQWSAREAGDGLSAPCTCRMDPGALEVWLHAG